MGGGAGGGVGGSLIERGKVLCCVCGCVCIPDETAPHNGLS